MTEKAAYGHSARARWTTGPRLLKLGESIEFRFSLPDGVRHRDLAVFPRYLERAQPGDAFSLDGGLGWLDALQPERLEPEFSDGRASLAYWPSAPGSYLARWRTEDEVLYRYFAAIEDGWTVLRFSPFNDLEPEPTLHATGIPLDYSLPVEEFDSGNAVFQRLLGYHRQYGDSVDPTFPDTPDMSGDDRVREYGRGLSRVRSLLTDGDARSARVWMRHELDPGYTATFERLGINDHYGLSNANARPYLGMPEFPYFASPVDVRKANQGDGGAVVAHQWDFCGGWHFLGPVSWHYLVSRGSWESAAKCLRRGMKEAQNLAEMSGHPAFLYPLYDGVTWHYTPQDGLFTEGVREEPHLRFVERYQRLMAFELPKEYRVAYSRSIDMADYFRRHFAATPRTVFVSKTDHIEYDMWWLCNWVNEHRLVTRERLPWLTALSAIMEDRRTRRYWKDPLSYEYILVEDQRRSIRFERESPNPIWWFDYTVQEHGPSGSAVSHLETPDVKVVRSAWRPDKGGLKITLKMLTDATFPDYAVALWGLPPVAGLDRSRIRTNATEFVLARNTDGECHLVLFFDLEPDAELQVTLLGAAR